MFCSISCLNWIQIVLYIVSLFNFLLGLSSLTCLICFYFNLRFPTFPKMPWDNPLALCCGDDKEKIVSTLLLKRGHKGFLNQHDSWNILKQIASKDEITAKILSTAFSKITKLLHAPQSFHFLPFLYLEYSKGRESVFKHYCSCSGKPRHDTVWCKSQYGG